MADRLKYTTPRVEAYEPSLNRTELYKGKDTGNYVCKIVLMGAALEQVREDINSFMVGCYGPKKAAKVWAECSPIKVTKDGTKSFIVFRMKAEGTDGKPQRVTIYDSKGNLVMRELHIGSGSIIKITGTMLAFHESDPGIAFYMDAIQVIKYVEETPCGGFEPVEEEGGFVEPRPFGPASESGEFIA